MSGLIAVEEHFLPGDERLAAGALQDSGEFGLVETRLKDTGQKRLAEMDRVGIEMAVVSLTAPGVQDEVVLERAVARARAANAAVAEIVATSPARYEGLAALPLQDPESACVELEHAIGTLGLRGVLVNGYSNARAAAISLYYDEPRYLPFWQLLAELDVPFYLHPRDPPVSQRAVYEGREELLGSTWAFTVETATHALRLITSGLFDRVPTLSIVLGHLGELLPFAIERVQSRLSHNPAIRLKKTLPQYLRDNFYITTSGNFHTRSLLACIEQLGADRILFATDYPYEDMSEAVAWFKTVPISEADRDLIGRVNAALLFRLDRQA